MADSHDCTALVQIAMVRAGDVDAWIHLGDMVSDADFLRDRSGLPVYSVRGNCDVGVMQPEEDVLTLGGARLFVCHGHRYRVNISPYYAALRAEELNCHAALLGHTHIPTVEASGSVLVINPGSLRMPRGGSRRSFAVLDITDGDICVRMMNLG